MSTITTKDGTQIYYKDWGSGQPVVLVTDGRRVGTPGLCTTHKDQGNADLFVFLKA